GGQFQTPSSLYPRFNISSHSPSTIQSGIEGKRGDHATGLPYPEPVETVFCRSPVSPMLRTRQQVVALLLLLPRALPASARRVMVYKILSPSPRCWRAPRGTTGVKWAAPSYKSEKVRRACLWRHVLNMPDPGTCHHLEGEVTMKSNVDPRLFANRKVPS